MFEMKPEYYIGIKMIDEQHEQLFAYADEAYELLKNLSADEKKRLEYEYREKCIRDHSAAIQSAAQHGFEEGIQKGKSELILNMNAAGYPISEISKIANLAEEEVQEILQKK